MQPETLKASVQYNDFQGTVAADHHDIRDLNDLGKKSGLDTDRYFVIGAHVHIGEVRDREVAHARLNLITIDKQQTKAGSIDFIRGYAEAHGKLPYQRFSIDVSLSELLDYFKRFDLVLFNRQLKSVAKFEEIELL